MLKKGLISVGMLLACTFAFGQSSRKLTKDQTASMTADQRFVHEVDRKSKHGKKDLSMKKRVKMSKKQDRRSRRIKTPKK